MVSHLLFVAGAANKDVHCVIWGHLWSLYVYFFSLVFCLGHRNSLFTFSTFSALASPFFPFKGHGAQNGFWCIAITFWHRSVHSYLLDPQNSSIPLWCTQQAAGHTWLCFLGSLGLSRLLGCPPCLLLPKALWGTEAAASLDRSTRPGGALVCSSQLVFL